MPTRRDCLIDLAALGAAAMVPRTLWGAQAGTGASARPFRIDTHHHFASPRLLAEASAKRIDLLAGMRRWTPQQSLDDMDRSDVATALLSVTEPGVWFGGDRDAARGLARESNEYAAKLIRDYPRRFGLFATLPLPDVDGSLREIEYALDTLKADGVCVLSSYQGTYLGDAAFTSVLDELNRRKAVVYCHPYCPACWSGATSPAAERLPDGQYRLTGGQGRGVELVVDTTRTIMSVLTSATATRCPDIRFIWSHGGGTVPYVSGRLLGPGQQLPNGVIAELQKFYYDTAQAFNPYTLPSFKKLVPISHILFGTDFPLGGGSIAEVAQGLIADGGFSAAELRAIDRENALRLFPRLNG